GEALEALRQAAETGDELRRRHPHHPRAEDLRALAQFRLGDLFREAGKLTEARPCLEEARGGWERLVRMNPNVVDYRTDLAAALNALGLVQADTGQVAGAQDSHRRARDLMRDAAGEAP